MSFQGREAVSVENDQLRVTVLREGGHIAEILHKKQGINPLWIPPWPSAEPSTYHPEVHTAYGLDSESKLLLGIMGHNLCLDTFGPPSDEEAAAGLTVHGESSVVRYEIEQHESSLKVSAALPLAGLSFQRTLTLEGESVLFHETVFNLSATDRPIAWTQHVTLGPPFLHAGTQFALPARQSRTSDDSFADDGVIPLGADFKWPSLPLVNGECADLSVFGAAPFSRYTAHLMASGENAGFVAFSPEHQLLIGYRWRRADFPWLGLWQENRMRASPPWSERGVACGLEFGVSPFPESRRQMIDRNRLFDTPVYRWLPAMGNASVSYRAFVRAADTLREDSWR